MSHCPPRRSRLSRALCSSLDASFKALVIPATALVLALVRVTLTHATPSCIGCGLWHPEADRLALLREDIDENADRWKEVLRESALRREFLNGAPDDDEAVVTAFAHANKESALKTKPKVCDEVNYVSWLSLSLAVL